MQPCRRRKKKGFTSIPFWPYGAFVNGRAEEITTFGGGRGAARLLTLVPLSSCLALIKMRCQPRMQMRFCGGGRGGSSPLPIPTSCQQMHGVSGEESHRRFHLNRNLFDKNIRPTRDGEVKAKEKLSLSLSLSPSFLQVVALTGPPVNLGGKVNSSICVSQGGSVLRFQAGGLQG